MELRKHLCVPIRKNIEFYEIELGSELVDLKYFIDKIDEGCLLNNNLSFKTNVKGEMTDWFYFNKDEKFLNILQTVSRSSLIKNLPSTYLVDSWGIKMSPGNYTKKHNHHKSHISGVLYLNETDNYINFPEIDVSIKPKQNTILYFSGILDHFTSPLENGIKYAIPFNMNVKSEWN